MAAVLGVLASQHTNRSGWSPSTFRWRQPFFTRYIERNGLTNAVRLHLGVSQNDRDRIRAAIEYDFGGQPVDAIIDDASHEYAATKAAFETTLSSSASRRSMTSSRDWAWGHGHNWPPDARADMPLMSPLLSGTNACSVGMPRALSKKVEINRRFAVIWRIQYGPATSFPKTTSGFPITMSRAASLLRFNNSFHIRST